MIRRLLARWADEAARAEIERLRRERAEQARRLRDAGWEIEMLREVCDRYSRAMRDTTDRLREMRGAPDE